MYDWKKEQDTRARTGGVDPMTRDEMEGMEREMKERGLI
jgi:hypothetical protein